MIPEPRNLIKEIILVNDNSDDEDIIKRIQQTIDTTPELSVVSLFTPDERLGLIRSRIFGSRKAVGEVLVFLDSHIEVQKSRIRQIKNLIFY